MRFHQTGIHPAQEPHSPVNVHNEGHGIHSEPGLFIRDCTPYQRDENPIYAMSENTVKMGRCSEQAEGEKKIKLSENGRKKRRENVCSSSDERSLAFLRQPGWVTVARWILIKPAWLPEDSQNAAESTEGLRRLKGGGKLSDRTGQVDIKRGFS